MTNSSRNRTTVALASASLLLGSLGAADGTMAAGHGKSKSKHKVTAHKKHAAHKQPIPAGWNKVPNKP